MVGATTDITNPETALRAFIDAELSKFQAVSGRTSILDHTNRLKPPTPIKQRYYPRNPAVEAIINAEVDRILQDDVIEPPNSPWSSPVDLVKKPKEEYRFCVDFRKLNGVCEKDAYPLPQINSILDILRDARYISIHLRPIVVLAIGKFRWRKTVDH